MTNLRGWSHPNPLRSCLTLFTQDYAIALGASFFFTIWLFLYAAKAFMYPRKVAKEWWV